MSRRAVRVYLDELLPLLALRRHLADLLRHVKVAKHGGQGHGPLEEPTHILAEAAPAKGSPVLRRVLLFYRGGEVGEFEPAGVGGWRARVGKGVGR